MLLQYANTKAPGGVDPLYLFRAQRALQRKDIHVWRAATQIDMAGERLEVAFDTLYPGKVGEHASVHISPLVSKACSATHISAHLQAGVPTQQTKQLRMLFPSRGATAQAMTLTANVSWPAVLRCTSLV